MKLFLIFESEPSETIKIWSAGCATGEEAYTIAMLCIEKGITLRVPMKSANDISQEAIQKAKQGVYKQSSFRTTDASYLQRFFTAQTRRQL